MDQGQEKDQWMSGLSSRVVSAASKWPSILVFADLSCARNCMDSF